MYRSVADFLHDLDYEREKTLACLDAIPETEKNRAVASGYRDLARLGWHLAATCVEMPASFGLRVDAPAGAPKTENDAVPATIAAVRAGYAATSAALAEAAKGYTDADLLVETPMYGRTWTKGHSLQSLLFHQAHHRGQMTVLLRQAGIRPPDVYGPAKEGWAAYGRKPPLV